MQWNEPYASSRTVRILATGQRNVSVPFRYTPKLGDLTVFYNGLYAQLGEDYIEVSPYLIQFKYDLEAGDTISFRGLKMW